VKVMIGLVRREDMSHDDFARWWLHDHAPLARTLPGVRRIRFNLLEEGAPFDGIAELWFDSATAADAAYATDIGKAVAADSLAHVASRVRMPVEEHAILN
jgi:uncharacterized protein (TIGR02118 family)